MAFALSQSKSPPKADCEISQKPAQVKFYLEAVNAGNGPNSDKVSGARWGSPLVVPTSG